MADGSWPADDDDDARSRPSAAVDIDILAAKGHARRETQRASRKAPHPRLLLTGRT